MSRQYHILIVDDEKAIRNTLSDILSYEGYEIETAEDGETALNLAQSNNFDLILLDIKMKGMDGLETLEQLQAMKVQAPVIMISGHGTIEIAVDATKKGAFDFIQKPPDLNRLLISVRNALSQSNLKRENSAIKSLLPTPTDIIGESIAIKSVKELIEKVAATSSRVLVTGSNGSGKELTARWLHHLSERKHKPFIAVNCAAFPDDLIESELFGYVKGAFTGADQDRKGKFVEADGGTLFLDEIGDMSANVQAKLLRVLQENEITPLGSNKTHKVDIRIISATNIDLKEAIKEKQFREDLYHRLSVIPIEIPALADRKEDIPLLIQYFLKQLKHREVSLAGIEIEKEAIDKLSSKSWPGNVRELQNTIERLAVLSRDQTITADDVQEWADHGEEDVDLMQLVKESPSFQDFKAESERVFLIHQLEKHKWNISRTAEAIGLQRSHIYNKIKNLGIER